jgi:hypothetical protein
MSFSISHNSRSTFRSSLFWVRRQNPQLILELDVAQEKVRNALFHREFGACVKKSSEREFAVIMGQVASCEYGNRSQRNRQE